MMEIVNRDGQVIPGLLRDKLGNIVVNNPKAKEDYLQRAGLLNRVKKLESDIGEVNQKLDAILSALNK